MKNNTIVIAEAGVNHNGRLNLAKKLINEAKKSGADIVKFQTFITDDLVKKPVKKQIIKKNSTQKSPNTKC